MLDKDISKDIQYLLNMLEAYIEDEGGNAYEDHIFLKLCKKYGFSKDNLHSGFENLWC